MPAFAILSCLSSRIPSTAQQTAVEEKTTKVNIFCTLLRSIVRGKSRIALGKLKLLVLSTGVEE